MVLKLPAGHTISSRLYQYVAKVAEYDLLLKESQPFKSKSEIMSVVTHLNDMCGDSFCNDLRFDVLDASCDSNSCTFSTMVEGNFFKATQPYRYRSIHEPIGYRAFNSKADPDISIKFLWLLDTDLNVREPTEEELYQSRSVGLYNCTINDVREKNEYLDEIFVNHCTQFDWD